MTFKQLEVFVAVADTGSFSKGGEAVSLAQSTASQHIRALEDEMQARLFDRMSTQVCLTEAGRLFYGHASGILKLCMDARASMMKFKGLEQAVLRMGASTIPASCLIPDILGNFISRWPGVRLDLQQGDTREVIRLLQDDYIEMAVVGGQIDDNGICYHEVGAEQILLVTKTGHAVESVITVGQLDKIPLILREPGSGTRQATDAALLKAGVDPKKLTVKAQLGSSEAIRRAVLGGSGFAFISSLAIKRELDEKQLAVVMVDGLTIERRFWLAVRRGRSLSPAAMAFKELLTTTFSLKPYT